MAATQRPQLIFAITHAIFRECAPNGNDKHCRPAKIRGGFVGFEHREPFHLLSPQLAIVVREGEGLNPVVAKTRETTATEASRAK